MVYISAVTFLSCFVSAVPLCFIRTTLTNTAGEENVGSMVVADVNNDSIPDIIAGLVWFEGPHWKPHQYYYPEEDSVYIENPAKCAHDINGDGYVDFLGTRAIDYRRLLLINELFPAE